MRSRRGPIRNQNAFAPLKNKAGKSMLLSASWVWGVRLGYMDTDDVSVRT